MIVFLTPQDTPQWIHTYHTAYIQKTTQCPTNKVLRKYDSVDSFCQHIHEWTPVQQQCLRQAILSIQQRCWTWRTFLTEPRWTLLAVDNQIDGGMPHTIHCAIVMPLWFREALCQEEHTRAYQNAIETLIHEQMHCLQKLHPEVFEALYTSWGYTKLSSLPEHQHVVRDIHQRFPLRTNPDTPQEWILNHRWYQTVLFHHSPKSLTNVSYVCIDVNEYALDASSHQEEAIRQQSDVAEFTRIFGTTAHCYHPDETSAVLLSQMMYNDYKTCMSNTSSTPSTPSTLSIPTPAEHLLVQWVYNVKW